MSSTHRSPPYASTFILRNKTQPAVALVRRALQVGLPALNHEEGFVAWVVPSAVRNDRILPTQIPPDLVDIFKGQAACSFGRHEFHFLTPF
jgi:hypothetical protein